MDANLKVIELTKFHSCSSTELIVYASSHAVPTASMTRPSTSFFPHLRECLSQALTQAVWEPVPGLPFPVLYGKVQIKVLDWIHRLRLCRPGT